MGIWKTSKNGRPSGGREDSLGKKPQRTCAPHHVLQQPRPRAKVHTSGSSLSRRPTDNSPTDRRSAPRITIERRLSSQSPVHDLRGAEQQPRLISQAPVPNLHVEFAA